MSHNHINPQIFYFYFLMDIRWVMGNFPKKISGIYIAIWYVLNCHKFRINIQKKNRMGLSPIVFTQWSNNFGTHKTDTLYKEEKWKFKNDNWLEKYKRLIGKWKWVCYCFCSIRKSLIPVFEEMFVSSSHLILHGVAVHERFIDISDKNV